MLAFTTYGDNEDGQDELYVSVVGLRSGREYVSELSLLSWDDEPSTGTEADVKILDVEISSSGRLALILSKTVPFGAVPAYEPYVVIDSAKNSSSGLKLLDHGSGIDVTSLRISGRNTFWMNDGRLHSERIR